MLEEYTIVRLKQPVPLVPVPLGTKGTVLLIPLSRHPAYEVEFIDDRGQSVGVYTMQEEGLEEEQEKKGGRSTFPG